MNQQAFILVEPRSDLRVEFLAMAEEFLSDGNERYKSALDDFSGYIERALKAARGEDLASDRVPYSEFWLLSDNRLLGRSTLRHSLNPSLEDEGGHIGYDIRPSERRKGYGTIILKLTLEKAKVFGLTRVLITCDADNTGSAKIIARNGGVLAEKAVSKKSGKPILRYWASTIEPHGFSAN
jgi:predicted acetyltransferase